MLVRRSAVDRSRCFAILFAALALNGGVTLAATTIRDEGLIAAVLNLFGISAILWMAGAAGVVLLWRAADDEPLRTGDGAWCVMAAAAMLLPVPAMSAAALTGLCLWVLLTTPAAMPLHRAALIFLSITTSLLWGRLLLALGSGPLLAGEGWLAGTLAGTGGSGNIVQFADGRFYSVAPGCSSLQGVSLAIVFWITVTQYFGVTVGRRAWLTLASAVAVVIAANIARLTAIALYPAQFDLLHVGFGATMFGWLALGGIVAVTWLGLRDALAGRA